MAAARRNIDRRAVFVAHVVQRHDKIAARVNDLEPVADGEAVLHFHFGPSVGHRLHVADVMAFIEKLDTEPVDLMGHSRGGHISFRVAQQRPDLLRRLVLAEPGGELDATLDPAAKPGPWPLAARIAAAAEKIAARDVEGGLTFFFDAIEGPGAWARLPAAPKQQLRDNAFTLIGQARDKRPPFSRADAESIRNPTLFIGGANTKGTLPQVLRALAAHVPNSKTAMIPNTTHPMFEQAPQRFCEVVLEFLAGR